MAADVSEILNLSKILQEHGEKVLSGASKLSLNADLLQTISSELNNICDNVGSSENAGFDVLSPHHGQSPTVRHLQFLHDFFQKTLGLKIVQNAHTPLSDDKIDLSKFKNLKYLELKRVPVKHLIGLKIVQPHLECIICERGLTALEQLLAECGSDNSTGFVWSELKEAVLSFNNIKTVDTSVAFAPWLQVLDLSHNQICDVKAIECLPNLKYVNLSFNSLNVIPVFNKSARKKVEVLVLKNNYIEDLNGLTGLDYLRELDLSNNWISNAQAFHPFLTMSVLQWLSLVGNPVYSLPNYRSSIIGYLHISASFGNFVLDRIILTKKERSRVGIELITAQAVKSRNSPTRPTSSELSRHQTEPQESLKPVRRSGKVRLAVIPNMDDGTYQDILCDLSGIPVQDTNTDHLETKKLIETARKTYKENWLRCEAAGVVQNILGLPQAGLSSTPYDDSCLTAALRGVEIKEPASVESSSKTITTAIIEPIPRDVDSSDERSIEKGLDDSFLTCKEDNASDYFSIESSVDVPKEWKETSPDIETITDSSEDREEEVQEKHYFATRLISNGSCPTELGLFLSLSTNEIRERDASTGRTLACWSLASLDSVTRHREGELHLMFDTIRRDRWERLYRMEESEAAELFATLRAEADVQSLAKLQEYRCISCSVTFPVQKRLLKYSVQTMCPVCQSKMVLPADSDKELIMQTDTNKTQKSSGHNRSASTGVADSIISQKMTKCVSQSSIGSTASLDEKRLPPTALTATGVKFESDIEIISNPSQSSIEVIDGMSPQRKRSVEEAQQPPPLITPVSAFAGLTESSSSGSGTDSVCTAYENSSMVSSGVSKKSGLESSVLLEEEVLEEKDDLGGKDFHHMLKEVLENVGAKDEKSSPVEIDKDVDVVKYSYQQFDQLDHRIKLFLYAHLFDDNAEQLVFLIRCQVLPLNSDHSFEACVVSSNRKLYVLKITGKEEGEEASKFLTKIDNFTVNLSSIKSCGTLAWNQGFSVVFRSHPTEYLILLKNPIWTKNFLSYIANNESTLPPHVEWSASPISGPNLRLTQFLLAAAEDTAPLSIALLNSCSVGETSARGDNYHEGALVVTSSDIFLISSLTWLFNTSKNNVPSAAHSQKLSDLIQAAVCDKVLRLQFLQESVGRQEVWSLTLASENVVEKVLSGIKVPWEDLFSVPFHVSNAIIF